MDWVDNKDRLLAELEHYISQCSQIAPPPLDYIAKLQKIRAHIQTANAAELDQFLSWWDSINLTKQA